MFPTIKAKFVPRVAVKQNILQSGVDSLSIRGFFCRVCIKFSIRPPPFPFNGEFTSLLTIAENGS